MSTSAWMSKPEMFKISEQNRGYGGGRTTVTGNAEFCFSQAGQVGSADWIGRHWPVTQARCFEVKRGGVVRALAGLTANYQLRPSRPS